jgi:hypothetical protein
MGGVAELFRLKVRRILGLPDDPGQPPDLMRSQLCWATVQAQNADGTVDVRPLDGRYSPEKNVKLSTPFPSTTVQVSPGALVVLAWAYGDPAQRFCLPIWGAGAQATSIVIGDVANDSLTIANGVVTIKVGGVVVLQASATKLALGLVGSLAVLVQGSTDAVFGAPVLQNPAAIATIVDAG